MPRLERLPELYNHAEVFLWTALALAFAAYGLRNPPERRRCALVALFLVAFAASDWVEARTGNRWWSPWWLLVWKAVCVSVFAGVFLERRYRRRQERSSIL